MWLLQAYNYYNGYARKIGFSVTKRRTNRNEGREQKIDNLIVRNWKSSTANTLFILNDNALFRATGGLETQFTGKLSLRAALAV